MMVKKFCLVAGHFCEMLGLSCWYRTSYGPYVLNFIAEFVKESFRHKFTLSGIRSPTLGLIVQRGNHSTNANAICDARASSYANIGSHINDIELYKVFIIVRAQYSLGSLFWMRIGVLENVQIILRLQMLACFRDLDLCLAWSLHVDRVGCGAHSDGERW